MKKYRITLADGREQHFIKNNFDSIEDAGEALVCYIKYHNEHLREDDDHLTPFDFKLEEVEVNEVNEKIPDFETAREYLGLSFNIDFSVWICNDKDNKLKASLVKRLIQSLNPSHIEALIALNELFTIAEAWNKEDGFVPDYADWKQEKWFPWFKYDNDAAGFVFASADNRATYSVAGIGCRICFKSSERAEQFGKQFAHLYNKVFLLNK